MTREMSNQLKLSVHLKTANVAFVFFQLQVNSIEMALVIVRIGVAFSANLAHVLLVGFVERLLSFDSWRDEIFLLTSNDNFLFP